MAGAISSAFVDLLLGVAVGLVGAVLARVVLRDRQQCPPWFVQLSAVFAWAWILFVPIGTVIGVLMLRWRRRPGASDSSA